MRRLARTCRTYVVVIAVGVTACAKGKGEPSKPPRHLAPAKAAAIEQAAFEFECEPATLAVDELARGGDEQGPWFDFEAVGCGKWARYRARCPKDLCSAERTSVVALD